MSNFKSKGFLSLNSRSFHHHRRRFAPQLLLILTFLAAIYIFLYDTLYIDIVEQVVYNSGGSGSLEEPWHDYTLYFDPIEQEPVVFNSGGSGPLEDPGFDYGFDSYIWDGKKSNKKSGKNGGSKSNNKGGNNGGNKGDNQKKFALFWPFSKSGDIIPIDSEYGFNLTSRIKVIDEVPIYQVPSGLSEPGEKYLTYLPHSQFNNQRISLENALMLAYYTNRTLILPPLILGAHKVAWLPFQQLYNSLQALKKRRSREKCVNSRYHNICDYWDSWSLIRWDEIFGNVPRFAEAEGLRIEWSNDFSLGKLKSKYNLTNDDIHYLRDAVRYGAKIYDDPQSTTPLGVYQARLPLAALQAIPHKLIYFESLYGPDRALYELPEHYAFNQRMVRELVYTHPGVKSVAEKIISLLGGKGTYVGVHVRGSDSDSYFGNAMARTIESLSAHVKELQVSRKQHAEHASFGTHEHCLHNSTSVPIYVATDISQPRTDKMSKQLFEMFSCVLTMSDFESFTHELDAFVNENDGLPMKRYLLPMIDMVVAAQGKTFVGTPLSTFSIFAARLHELSIENGGNV
ncbi:11314_t:CDS:2 [Paraglomus occultum]|uniref:11314_t:CDS:1 n=1 Tax=Paraglomus occultum TaxID=144539 RepID=A0A9N9FBZ1_9GLOM|nr:11314_t:CDS:2 [Paraglomus occultum]